MPNTIAPLRLSETILESPIVREDAPLPSDSPKAFYARDVMEPVAKDAKERGQRAVAEEIPFLPSISLVSHDAEYQRPSPASSPLEPALSS